MDLFRNFSPEQYASALSSWTFIDLTDKTPTFTSSFGDVFFTSPTGYWWLDTLEGRLEQPWPNHKAMEAELKTDEGLDHYLAGAFAIGADRAGLIPSGDQVYGWRIAPAIGGQFELANIEVVDFVVSINVLGQIHSQIRDLPPGAKISGLTIE